MLMCAHRIDNVTNPQTVPMERTTGFCGLRYMARNTGVVSRCIGFLESSDG